MKKYTETIEKTVQETVEFTVSPCINCGNSKILIDNYGDFEKTKPIQIYTKHGHENSGRECFTAGAICHKCGYSFVKEGKWKSDGAYIWNYHNDVKTLIAREQVKIKMSNDRIEELNKLLK